MVLPRLAFLLGLWVFFNDGNDGGSDGLLVRKSSLRPEHVGQLAHEQSLFPRVLQGQGPQGLHHHYFELVGNVVEEGGDGAHEPVDGPFAACFQEGGDGQGSDGPVHILKEVLKVQVASGYCLRVGGCNLAQGTHGCEPAWRYIIISLPTCYKIKLSNSSGNLAKLAFQHATQKNLVLH